MIPESDKFKIIKINYRPPYGCKAVIQNQIVPRNYVEHNTTIRDFIDEVLKYGKDYGRFTIEGFLRDPQYHYHIEYEHNHLINEVPEEVMNAPIMTHVINWECILLDDEKEYNTDYFIEGDFRTPEEIDSHRKILAILKERAKNMEPIKRISE